MLCKPKFRGEKDLYKQKEELMIEDPLMRDIRYLDKLVDELAKGKAMEKILRT